MVGLQAVEYVAEAQGGLQPYIVGGVRGSAAQPKVSFRPSYGSGIRKLAWCPACGVQEDSSSEGDLRKKKKTLVGVGVSGCKSRQG